MDTSQKSSSPLPRKVISVEFVVKDSFIEANMSVVFDTFHEETAGRLVRQFEEFGLKLDLDYIIKMVTNEEI